MNTKNRNEQEANIQNIRNQNRFLARSVLLEETGSSRLIRFGILFIGFVLIALVTWSSFMKVDEMALAQGEIFPQGELNRIQHLVGGKVQEIKVQDGQFVKKGDVLITLDPQESRLKLDEIKVRQLVLQATQIRLNALLNGNVPDFEDLKTKAPEICSDQIDIYYRNIETDKSGKQILVQQFAQIKSELVELYRERKKLRREKVIIKKELDIRKGLVEKGLNSKIALLKLERSFSDIIGRLEQMTPRQTRLTAKRDEVSERLKEFDNKLKEQYSENVAKVNEELMRINKTMEMYTSNIEYLQVTSPIDGYVHGLRLHANGEVVESGATLMEIVPADKELVAMVRIQAQDIGHVQVGQKALIRFTAYNFRRYGGVEAELIDVSPSAFLQENGESYYKGVLRLKRNRLGENQNQKAILPGMTISADIKTGSKSLLEYVLKPIYASQYQSFRER